jgi:uncharacterized RDD family membrane protein YckC
MEEPTQATSTPFSEGAGFGIRAAARIIDLIYGLGLMLIAGLLAGIALVVLEQAGLVESGWENRVGEGKLLSWVLGLLTVIILHSVTEGMYGASLGKLICRLHVVAEDGQPVTLAKAFKRSLAYCWDSLFFGVIGYSSMKRSALNQRYGDHWARTVVVKSREVSAGGRSGIEIFILALLMGSVAVVACGAAVTVVEAL